MPTVNDEMPWWRQRALADARDGRICPECLGIGWVRPGDLPIGDDWFGKLVRCACYEGEMTQYLKESSGLVGWMRSARLASFESSGRMAQYQAVKALLDRGAGWLSLWGPPGRGKTYLLAAAVNWATAQGKPAVYVTAEGLLGSLRDAYGADRFSEVRDQWQRCKVLAVDDLDHYQRTEWAHARIHELLDYRYNEALGKGANSITLFASNAPPGGDGWPRDLDPLYSRMTHFEIVGCQGPDMRAALKDSAL